MKLLKCYLANFGSYHELEFDFSNLDLSLVYGATGSGKSSLLDAAPWILFSVTAKDGKVDDVRPWQTGEATKGCLKLEARGVTLWVYRVRGTPGENDLFWCEDANTTYQNRGKDIKDTQRLLNERLGITPELYLAAAYASDFSPTARFFTDTAKRQREIFDLVADLSFPITLAERASNVRKEAKKELEEAERSYAKAVGRFDELLRSKDLAVKQAASWEKSQARAITELEARAKNFETEKAQRLNRLVELGVEWSIKTKERLAELDSLMHEASAKCKGPCPTCGAERDRAADMAFDRLRQERAQLLKAGNPFAEQIEDIQWAKSGYPYMIKAKKEETNPHHETITRLCKESENADITAGAISVTQLELEAKISSLTQLIDISSTMRGTLLTQTVAGIQAETNRILETYFDGEIRVTFTLDGDSLQVGITKNGYECSYAQLSKGQRQLLKLSFMISVMKSSANEAGVRFEQLFFDEACDGLDTDLKVKAYGLFQELAKDRGVLVVDHSSELRELFESKYHVTLNGDHSEIQFE